MLVTRILGDCPSCGGKNRFGNVSVNHGYVLRGCMNCKHSTTVWLPAIRKKIVYLDQFFLSGAFKGGDPRIAEAAKRIRELSNLQLLVVPFSSIHEDETHQWRGYGGKNKDELMEFIKATSRGHEFEPAYDVEQTQIIRAFQAFLVGKSSKFELDERDAVEGNIHEWDDYLRIDVGHYIGDIELIRDLKRQATEGLVDIFEDWRRSTNTFEQDVALEVRAAAKSYLDSYFTFAKRIASGDYDAIIDSPVISSIVQSMLYCFSEETPPEDRLKQVSSFFISEHFANVPYQWYSARIFAVLKDMVKRGAYKNRENTLGRLSGFFQDVRHVATYVPYCDAFVMDQPMAALVADPRVGLNDRYAVRIFSLNNWDEFFAWLDALKVDMSEEHKAGLSAAYG